MKDSLVQCCEVSEYLDLPISSGGLGTLLLRWEVMADDYVSLPGGCRELVCPRPEYRDYDLGAFIEHPNYRLGDPNTEWAWNERGRKIILALFERMPTYGTSSMAKFIVKDTLNSMRGGVKIEILEAERRRFLDEIKNIKRQEGK